MVEVYPETHALSHFLPVTDIAHDGVPTALGKFSDTHLFFNFFLVENAQLFFDLMLYRQTVCIPPGFAWHVEATHGLETRINVFETACQHMMYARPAISGRWAFVKGIKWAPFTLFKAASKYTVVTPERQDALLQRRAVIAGSCLVETHIDSRTLGSAPNNRLFGLRGDSNSLGVRDSRAVPPGSTQARYGPGLGGTMVPGPGIEG